MARRSSRPALGRSIIVDNRPGAAGIIGAAIAAKSPADGYTIVAVNQGTLAFSPFLYSKPGYDALKDFAPIARVLHGSMVLAVNTETPANTLIDLLKIAKSQPGKLSNGTAGVGSPPYMAGELFRCIAGVVVILVPFQAGNFAVTDLVAGRVTYTIDGIGITLPHVKSGKLRMLAVSGPKRMPQIPDVPTFAEAGLPDYAYDTWSGVCAPVGTPPEIVSRLAAEIAKIMATPEGRESVLALGWEPFLSDTPEAFAAYVKAEYAKWGDFIRQAGMMID